MLVVLRQHTLLKEEEHLSILHVLGTVQSGDEAWEEEEDQTYE